MISNVNNVPSKIKPHLMVTSHRETISVSCDLCVGIILVFPKHVKLHSIKVLAMKFFKYRFDEIKMKHALIYCFCAFLTINKTFDNYILTGES